MQAKETTFQALIEGSKQFVVPLYQRTYSWKEAQLQRLWSDVLEQTELAADGLNDGSHFIGSIVLAPSPELGAVGVQRWVVVDGQQRLTTLMLLLSALRDHLAVDEPIVREKFNDLYLINKWEQGERQLRLLPTQDDRVSFAACVHSTADAGGNDAIGFAYRFFRRELVAAGDPADPHDLSLIEGVVARNLVLVGITASSRPSPKTPGRTTTQLISRSGCFIRWAISHSAATTRISRTASSRSSANSSPRATSS